MHRRPTAISVAMAAIVLLAGMCQAQSYQGGLRTRSTITQPVDESRLVTLSGNTRSEANAENDRGRVDDATPLEHVLLQLQRPPEVERELANLIDEMHRPGSPNFHQWILPQELGVKFGVSQADMAKITNWLESHGFRINKVFPTGMVIDFSGNAGQVREAFHTEIHNLEVNGEVHIANMSDPRIPAALAGVVKGVVSLHNFMPRPMYKMRPNYTYTSGTQTLYSLVPADLATIYNLNPLFAAGYTGTGQTVVVIEDTNVYNTGDWTTFRNTFGLSSSYPAGSFTQVHPGGCTNPGVNGDEIEAIIDAQWASAAAPNAAIELASCESSVTFGGLIALENLLSAGSPPAIMSISYGNCEAENGAAGNAAYNSAYQSAVAAGVSVFVAAGDDGAASCDANDATGKVATHGIGVSGFASTVYNVAVGGTDYSDTYAGTNSTYWNSANTSTYGSAKSYIPEIPWNDSCASGLISSFEGFSTPYGTSGFCNSTSGEAHFLSTSAGSGGPSGCATGSPSTTGVVGGSCAGYPKPSWQSVFGNPSDGVRDLPDVSLFAANGVWGHFYIFCDTDPSDKGTCTGAPSGWLKAGGTSFSSPIVAGVMALVNEKQGRAQGNPNPRLYALARAEYGAGGSTACNSSNGNAVGSSCVFYDVTLGDMDVDCSGTHDCFLPSGTYGVLSTSNSANDPAFGTATGWDFSTGIGTLNAYNLVFAWSPAATATAVSSSLNPSTIGQSVTFTATVTPAGPPIPTGTISFTSNGAGIAGCSAVVLSSSRTAICTTTFVAVGTDSIEAAYSGDASYAGSTGTLSQVVNKVATATALISSVNPSTVGQSVTFTATVSPAGPPTPTGTISFTSNGAGIIGCSAVTLSSSRTATCTNTFVATGTDSIEAAYSGDNNYTSSTGTLSQVVNKAASATAVTSSVNPSTVGAPVTLIATVTGWSPTGTVGFTANGATISGCGSVTLSSGVAECTTTFTTKGSYSIVAAYSGNSSNAGSGGTLTQVVGATTTTVTSSLNPSTSGESVTLTATVAPTGPPTPTGTVGFASLGTTISGCSVVTLSASLTAACTTTALPVGTDAIVATYSGDTNYTGSSGTFPQLVNPIPTAVQFVPVTPCRVVDTRGAGGPFGGPAITGGTARTFTIPSGPCPDIPTSASAYSLNVTAVPPGPLGYLTIWPAGEGQPTVSTLNSPDGRTKANAAIVPAGASGAISVFANETTNVLLDINGYFATGGSSTLQFYPLTPCRVADTRNATGPLGGPSLVAKTERDFPVQSSSCAIPSTAQAYSLNFTVVPPAGGPLSYLTVWPQGEAQPVVSTLNDPTGTNVANAAIVQAGTSGNGGVAVYPTNATNLLIDVNGYFAALGSGGYSLYTITPCRTLDTRGSTGAFTGELTVNIAGSLCAPPSTSEAYVFNATAVPEGALGYLTLWPDPDSQPLVSTLNALDGAITSNMAIVPNLNGKTDAYANGTTQLILDIFAYFAP